MPNEKEKTNGLVVLAAIIIAVSVLLSSFMQNTSIVDLNFNLTDVVSTEPVNVTHNNIFEVERIYFEHNTSEVYLTLNQNNNSLEIYVNGTIQ